MPYDVVVHGDGVSRAFLSNLWSFDVWKQTTHRRKMNFYSFAHSKDLVLLLDVREVKWCIPIYNILLKKIRNFRG